MPSLGIYLYGPRPQNNDPLMSRPDAQIESGLVTYLMLRFLKADAHFCVKYLVIWNYKLFLHPKRCS